MAYTKNGNIGYGTLIDSLRIQQFPVLCEICEAEIRRLNHIGAIYSRADIPRGLRECVECIDCTEGDSPSLTVMWGFEQRHPEYVSFEEK